LKWDIRDLRDIWDFPHEFLRLISGKMGNLENVRCEFLEFTEVRAFCAARVLFPGESQGEKEIPAVLRDSGALRRSRVCDAFMLIRLVAARGPQHCCLARRLTGEGRRFQRNGFA
jgi:hypothetical protein